MHWRHATDSGLLLIFYVVFRQFFYSFPRFIRLFHIIAIGCFGVMRLFGKRNCIRNRGKKRRLLQSSIVCVYGV